MIVLAGVVALRRTVVGLAFFLFVSVFAVLPITADDGVDGLVAASVPIQATSAAPMSVDSAALSQGSTGGSWFDDVWADLVGSFNVFGSRGVGVVAEFFRFGALVPPVVDPWATVELDPALVGTVAGDGTAAVVDGVGAAASFADPRAVTATGLGMVVAEENALRVVDRGTGAASTWLGDPAVAGCVDSSDPSLVRFTDIGFLATDQTYLYVADSCAGMSGHHSIRVVDLATGATTTLTDSSSAVVTVYDMHGFVVGPDGFIYVTYRSASVDRIDPATGA